MAFIYLSVIYFQLAYKLLEARDGVLIPPNTVLPQSMWADFLSNFIGIKLTNIVYVYGIQYDILIYEYTVKWVPHSI